MQQSVQAHRPQRQAPAGVDLLSLDGLRAVRCLGAAAFPEVRRVLRVAKWVYKAGQNSYKGWT